MVASEVSCQPEKPSVADRLVLVSNGSSSTSMLHVPSNPIGLVKFTAPSTEEVNVIQTSGTESDAAMDESTLDGGFSKERIPVMMVVAPAPATGASIAFGPV